MIFENEITVEVNSNLEKLQQLLKKNNFKIMKVYDLIDIYMVPKNINKNDNYLEILNRCVLIRNVVSKTSNRKIITYKYKEYDEFNNITRQGKVDCDVYSIENSVKLFESINYEKLINIFNHSIVYSNGIDEFVVQCVNDKHIYIEIEDKCNFINKKYENIEEMINVIKKYKIPMIGENYFVKKAEIEMKETLN